MMMPIILKLSKLAHINKFRILKLSKRDLYCEPARKVNRNLICFKYWSPEMVTYILESACNLKTIVKLHSVNEMDLLKHVHITMILEKHEPILQLAVSDGAALLGARCNTVIDKIIFKQYYMGAVFSQLADVLVVSAGTHRCVELFSRRASSPVLCIRSLFHQPLHALAAMMTVMEEFGNLEEQSIAYIGPPAPILNSYLLICPMVGVDLKYFCCNKKFPVSPMLMNISSKMCCESGTEAKKVTSKEEALECASVVISGPSKDVSKESDTTFSLKEEDINKMTKRKWIYIHTIPRGSEISEELFEHSNARTIKTIANMKFMAAALIANSAKNRLF